MATEKKQSTATYTNRQSLTYRLNAVVLILLGGILLLNTLGIIGWNVWNAVLAGVLKFWPFFILVAGFLIVIRKKHAPRHALQISAYVFFLFLVGASLFTYKDIDNPDVAYREKPLWERLIFAQDSRETTQKTTITEDEFPNMTKRIMRFDIEAGNIVVRDGQSNAHMMLDSLYEGDHGKPAVDANLSKEGVLTINVAQEETPNYFKSLRRRLRYYATTGENEHSTNLFLDLTAGRAKYDLSLMSLDEFHANVTAGKLEGKFVDNARSHKMNLHVTAGEVHILFPQDVALRIDANKTLGSIAVNGEEVPTKDSQKIYNEGAERTITVQANATLGTIRFEISDMPPEEEE